MARARPRLILMLGPSMACPGGMTEVVRAYGAAGLFAAWPVQYLATYAGKTFLARVRPWLRAMGTVLVRLAQGRVAMLHLHSAAFGSFWRKSTLCALAWAFRVPYVVHMHDGNLSAFYQRGCNGVARAWMRFVLRKAARVVVLTPHWRDEVHGIEPAARIRIIGNPVSVPARLAPLHRPARSVLFLAWLQKEKGVLDLVRAAPSVLLTAPDARFVIAGRAVAGSETPDSIRRLARRLGVEHALRFAGWVDSEQKHRLLQQCDVFVLPSYVEGLPVALLEAMAWGMPVVATRVGGIPDVIEDRVNGLLVEPGEPAALARAIADLLGDDALRSRMREAAHRDVARRYRVEAVIDELGRLYRELGVPPGGSSPVLVSTP